MSSDLALSSQKEPPITYDAPPLVEVAVSVQFDPPKRLNQAHLGAFWFTQKSEFPNVRAVQPIPTVTEVFAEQGQWLPPSLQLALTNEPESRLQMTSSDDQWMCQIQRNRLVVNWRKRTADYPRFSATQDAFIKTWERWQDFLGTFALNSAKPTLWELAYVNRIAKTNLWKSPSDWPAVFPGLWGGKFAGADDAQLSAFHGQWVWESSSPNARLYVEPKPAKSADETEESILLLTLTARGPISQCDGEPDGGTSSIESGMQCGHHLIVTTFDKITSSAAKSEWGRHDSQV